MARNLDKAMQSHLLRTFFISVADIYTPIHTAFPGVNQNPAAQDVAH